MNKIFALILVINIAGAAQGATVAEVSGQCKKEIMSQSQKYVNKKKEIEFQGFGDLEYTGDENVFFLTYGFDDECQGGLEIKINALKVIKGKYPKEDPDLNATECTVDKLVGVAPNCG